MSYASKFLSMVRMNNNESVEENIKGIRVVKSFVREDYETEKFHNASENIRRIFTKAERILALNSPLMQMCMYSVMLFVLSVGSKRIITTGGQALDIGQFSTLLTYSFQILSSLMMLSMIFVMITFSAESAQRVCEVLSEESTIRNPEQPVTEVKDGSIDFDHVTFRYYADSENPVLDNIDLHIRSGETIGIIGGTGSSKSSLVQLIPRLYDISDIPQNQRSTLLTLPFIICIKCDYRWFFSPHHRSRRHNNLGSDLISPDG